MVLCAACKGMQRPFALAKHEPLPYSMANMKIKRTAFFVAVSFLFTLTAWSEDSVYQESTRGNYTYLNPFSHKPSTPAEHLDYAVSLREKGKLTAARKQFDILVKRWPESPQAAEAMQAVGDIYFKQGEDAKAFEAYEELIQRYYTGLKNYDRVLENQYTIAKREMNRKRMRLLFGGYSAPERAIPDLESIIRNAPQWERAPQIQFEIAEAYRANGERVEAIQAYSTLAYRYPDSPFAEKAAFAKIETLKDMVEDTPYSVDLREDAQMAAELFTESYTNSEYASDVVAFTSDLAEQAAKNDFEIADFYERVPDPIKKEAARIYYQKVINEHSDTDYAARAKARLRDLFPEDEKAPAAGMMPVQEGAEQVERGPLPDRFSADEEAIDVSADRLEYEGDLLVGEGNVAVQQEGASLQADHISVNPETGDITATGNIVMLHQGGRWEGENLVYNFKTKEGNFGVSEMHFDPVYITAERIERVSSNEYRMVNARLTTCSGDKPLIYAKAREVTILDEDKPSGRFVKAKDVTFYVGKVPVFYTPHWQRHLGERVFTFSVGYGGRLGVFIMGRATLPINDWLTSSSHLDLYSARGAGFGQDFRWETKNGRGGIQTYYINDGYPYEHDDTAAERALIDSQRYRVRLNHHEQFDDETYFRAEFNYLSDPDVLEDFFNDEFRQQANPENYAVLQRSTDQYAAGLRVDRRLNDFYTTVNRSPQLSADWYRAKLGESPLFFQSDNHLGFYEMLHSSTNAMPDYRSGRFDTFNQVFLPIRIKKFFNLIPRAAYRGTWYSDTPAGSQEYRNIFELGTLASFKAHKVLTDKSGFYGEGLRHIVEPYAEYLYRDSSIATNKLYQFDEIDALDNRNEVRFGLRNFIQTKRGAKRIVNFLDADVFTSYRLDHAEDGNDFGPLEADLQMRLTDRFRIQSDLEYNMYDSRFNDYNARASYTSKDQSQYAVEYRYLDGERSLISTSAELFPNDDWSYFFRLRYDSTWKEWRDREIMVNHRFDCVGMGVGLKVDEDDELSLWFQLWLTAFDRPTVQDRIR